MCEAIIQIQNLHKSFNGKKVIEDLNLQVGKGEVYGFLGPNGSGKTTTIKMILGLIFPDSGSIHVFGEPLNHRTIARVGAMIETPRFYEGYTGYQNLKLFAGLYDQIPDKRVHEVLEMVGLSARSGDKVKRYSLGMKQRLGIAGALLNHPELVILDEPTNGLDPQGMKEVREMVVQLAMEQDITFFISTHLLHEVELICSKVAILHKGKKMAEGRVDSLLQGEIELLALITNAPAAATSKLQNIAFVKSVSPIDGGVELALDKGFSNEVIKLLVQHNIELKYAYPRNKTLESLFLDLTKGETHRA